jgi:NTE family protein
LGKVLNLVRSVRAFAKELGRERDLVVVPSKPPARPRIGLALGGGFARGLAHIGVLKVLEENHIPIDFVAGTSVGSIIGAAFCSGISATELAEIAALVRFRDFARLTISRLGLCTNDRMAAFLTRFLKAKDFEHLNIPLAITATDFTTGEGMVWTSGPLVDPVRASCAYPGIFLPVRVNGRLYVDGLLTHAVPTNPLRDMGAERVLAVYLSAHWVNLDGPRHVFDVIGQCFSIAQSKMRGLWQSAADLIVTPDVRGFSYDAFEHAKALVDAGERAAREALPVLLQWVGEPAASAVSAHVPSLDEKLPQIVAAKPTAVAT